MKIYKSTETDPKHSSNSYYGWVKVKNGKIIQIGEELIREGGVTWEPDFGSNGDLKTCMRSIARKWPNLYQKVRKLHKLPTIKNVKRAEAKRELSILEKDISDLRTKLFNKKEAAYKLKLSLR